MTSDKRQATSHTQLLCRKAFSVVSRVTRSRGPHQSSPSGPERKRGTADGAGSVRRGEDRWGGAAAGPAKPGVRRSNTQYLTYDPIDLTEWRRLTVDARDGASVEFLGVVRGQEHGDTIECLEYDAYEPMAERVIARLVEQAKQRWPVHAVCVQHRCGRIPVGHLALFVGVRAEHRREAFEACQFLIDAIKREAPIWKRALRNAD